MTTDELKQALSNAVEQEPDATIADAILDRLMQKHHRFTLTGDSLRQKPKTIKKEPNTEAS